MKSRIAPSCRSCRDEECPTKRRISMFCHMSRDIHRSRLLHLRIESHECSKLFRRRKSFDIAEFARNDTGELLRKSRNRIYEHFLGGLSPVQSDTLDLVAYCLYGNFQSLHSLKSSVYFRFRSMFFSDRFQLEKQRLAMSNDIPS